MPGLFLLFLGAGNILVGDLKTKQYQEVLVELEAVEEPLPLENSGILTQIQNKRDDTKKISKSRIKALGRIDLYRLVTFGGKTMLTLGGLLLFTGLAYKLLKPSS